MGTDAESQLMDTLIKSVNDLSQRVLELENAINRGRGAFGMFLTLLTIIGTVIGAVKFLGK